MDGGKRVFVTGGNGFIGTNLCKKLNNMGYQVVSYDIQEKKVDIPVKWIKGDILDSEHLVCSMKNADIVIHLAAMVGVADCLKNADMVYSTNVIGTDNVISACEVNKIKNVLFASSSEVYGEGYVDEMLVEKSRTKPKSLYAKTKMQAEDKFKDYSIANNAKVSVLRYSNIYGPYQRNDFLISLFINQMLNNRPLSICGDGNQMRCFTYIDDAVEFTVRTMERKADTLFEIFNISYLKASTVMEVVSTLEKVVDRKLSVSMRTYQELGRDSKCEIINRIISSEKAQMELGYQPKVSLYDGLKKTLQFYDT